MPEKKVQKGRASKDSKEKFRCCVKAALDQKAEDLVSLDVTEFSSFADYFIICHGESGRQVRGIARHIKEELYKSGFEPIGIEGLAEGEWVLMDYNDIIIHVFRKATREFYNLERLWIESPRTDITDKES